MGDSGGYAAFSNMGWYTNLLRGAQTRLTQYKQYDGMDYGDISRALDIIAEEMSNKDERTELPFIINYQTEENQNVSDVTATTLRAALRHWSRFHGLNKKIFNVARIMSKYGDCFFRKISDTKKWEYVDPTRVIGVEINEVGEKVAYHIKPAAVIQGQNTGKEESVEITPAEAILHFTTSDEMTGQVPFGKSLLADVFRDWQKLQMLEDSAIIYRIVRAPERRVFYIDVGNMPPQRVKQYLEQIRNEIRQRRIPNANNQPTLRMDSTILNLFRKTTTSQSLQQAVAQELKHFLAVQHGIFQNSITSCRRCSELCAFLPAICVVLIPMAHQAAVNTMTVKLVSRTLKNFVSLTSSRDFKST
jgi:hypothetical protein